MRARKPLGVAVAAAALVLALPAAPAFAEPPEALLLSLSPQSYPSTYATDLPQSPWTDAPDQWVPGDAAHATVYVLTRACTLSTGSIAVAYSGADANGYEFADALQFSVTLNGQGPVPTGSTFQITGNTINELQVTALFPFGDDVNLSANETQADIVAGLTLIVTLECAEGQETTFSEDPGLAEAGDSEWVDEAGSGGLEQLDPDPPTVTPTGTPSPTEMPSPSPSPSVTPTATPTSSPTATQTPTSTASPTTTSIPPPSPSGTGGPGWHKRGTVNHYQPSGSGSAQTGVNAARSVLASAALILGGAAAVGAARRQGRKGAENV